jgi:DNA-binding MarR family transcriptional regulator
MKEMLQHEPRPDPQGEPPSALLAACTDALEQVTPRLGRVFKSQMKEGPLTVQQMMMLRAIQSQTRPGDLARRCNISSSATTAALDGLVRDGFCARVHSEEDRREVLVHVTPAGSSALAEAQSGARTAIQEMLFGWTDEQMQRLLTVLEDLEGAVDTYFARHGR